MLEGGAIDVNGRGTLLTTEECLLDPVVQARNPGFGPRRLRGGLPEAPRASRKVLWLGRGIAGDDTHGHVDDLAPLRRPRRTSSCAGKRDPADANYAPLEENRERLQEARTRRTASALGGRGAPHAGARSSSTGRVSPRATRTSTSRTPPCSCPTFNDPNDRRALGILAELFPDREVVGIHAVDLVWGLGTLHCMTQQQPRV